MLSWLLTFLVIAIIAGLSGFTAIAAGAAGILGFSLMASLARGPVRGTVRWR